MEISQARIPNLSGYKKEIASLINEELFRSRDFDFMQEVWRLHIAQHKY